MVVFSLGLSGTGRDDNARSLSLTTDVPPTVMVNLIGCDGYRKTHLNEILHHVWRNQEGGCTVCGNDSSSGLMAITMCPWGGDAAEAL